MDSKFSHEFWFHGPKLPYMEEKNFVKNANQDLTCMFPYFQITTPVQNWTWQGPLSIGDPVQFAPPLLGEGLLHARWRLLCPRPHVVLHPDHIPQTDQPPSTFPAGIICVRWERKDYTTWNYLHRKKKKSEGIFIELDFGFCSSPEHKVCSVWKTSWLI